MGYEGEAEYITNPLKSYQQFTLADLSKSMKEIAYSPEYDISKGVKDMLNPL
jgi:UDP-glucose 4-epimerase